MMSEESGSMDHLESVRLITPEQCSEMTFTSRLRTNGGMDIPDRKS